MLKSEVGKLVQMLMAAYPNSKADPKTAAVYEMALTDLDLVKAQRAVLRLLSTTKFLPTISEIREAATALDIGPRRSGAEAWCDVMKQIDDEGAYGTPSFDDPIVADIVKQWGWRRLCFEGSLESDRARFIETYEAIASRRREDAVSGIPLPPPKYPPKQQQLPEPVSPKTPPQLGEAAVKFSSEVAQIGKSPVRDFVPSSDEELAEKARKDRDRLLKEFGDK
ncbi:MAG: hypothetical protein WC551_07865 [Patescibacteria group bacterium]